jgi:RimJ/RimL family protein N-acetyltransferase
MIEPKVLIKASLDAGRELLRFSKDRPANAITVPAGRPKPAPVLVPIRSIGPSHRERIANHLLALGEHDRYLRFGYAANDEQIRRYAASLDFERDEIFGIYNRKLELIAMAHLAFSPDKGNSCAEFGVSVVGHARGRGYGARLFDRAMMHARNEGVSLIFIHALSENTAMLKIARNAGATVERDGSESEAYLRLPPATLDSRMTELVEEQFAQTDYRLKVQAKEFRDFLSGVQEVRQGIRDGRHRSGQ